MRFHGSGVAAERSICFTHSYSSTHLMSAMIPKIRPSGYNEQWNKQTFALCPLRTIIAVLFLFANLPPLPPLYEALSSSVIYSISSLTLLARANLCGCPPTCLTTIPTRKPTANNVVRAKQSTCQESPHHHCRRIPSSRQSSQSMIGRSGRVARRSHPKLG